MSPDFLISRIYQKDKATFAIEWGDGRIYDYTLPALQKCCPCARCRETGPHIDPDVRAVRLFNFGRYAMRIEFTSGCSRGIYTYAFLKEWGKLSCART